MLRASTVSTQQAEIRRKQRKWGGRPTENERHRATKGCVDGSSARATAPREMHLSKRGRSSLGHLTPVHTPPVFSSLRRGLGDIPRNRWATDAARDARRGRETDEITRPQTPKFHTQAGMPERAMADRSRATTCRLNVDNHRFET